MVDLPRDHFQLMLFALDQGFLCNKLVLDDMHVAIVQELGYLRQRHIQHTQVPDCVQHLELLGTVIPVPGARVDIFGFQQAATLIMPKRAQRHIEHICNLAYTEQSAVTRQSVAPSTSLTRRHARAFSEITP